MIIETVHPGQSQDMPLDYHDLEILNAISLALQQSLRLEEVIKTAADQILSCLNASGVCIYLKNEQDFYQAEIRGEVPPIEFNPMDSKTKNLITTVGKTGNPVFYETFSEEAFGNAKIYKSLGVVSLAVVAITGREGVLGVLELLCRSQSRFENREKQLIDELGSLIGLSVQNALLYEDASNRARRYIAVSRSITVTRQLGSLEDVLQDFARVIVQTFGFDRCWLGLADADPIYIMGIACFGLGLKQEDKSLVIPFTEENTHPAVEAVKAKEVVVCKNTGRSSGDQLLDHSVRSYGFIPILSSGRALGVIGVFSLSNQPIQEDDIKALSSVSEQAATAIENVRLYEQVKKSEQRYRMLFEEMGSGLAILDPSLKFKLANQAFERLSGHSGSELAEGVSLQDFFKGISSDNGDVIDKIHNPPQNFETDFVSREGTKKQVHLTATRIPGSQDILISMIDMTRERELERRLYKSEELASIGELSAGIAHEIRNPLVSIKNSVSLLKDEPDISEEGNQLRDVVKEEGNHLAAIVDDFLKFARPKKPAMHKENINQLLSEAVKRCQEWNSKEIEWIEKYDAGLPKLSLDRHQIHQVITNLLMNGIDAVPEGGQVRLESRRKRSKKDPHILVTISDNGMGIPERNLDKIFQPFFSTKEKGTGMGLAICRRIIEEHQGEISVSSTENNGTTFQVKLYMNPTITVPT